MKGTVDWVSANALAFLFLVVIVGVFGLIVWITKYLIERDKVILAANADNSERIPFSAMFVMIILGGTVFVGLLAWIFQPSQESATNGFGTLAGLILLGMVVFIGIMNILTLSAARIGMLDGRQPFGLPEGSVRAILTIAFIVLVGVLSSFLLTGSNNRTGYSTKGVELEVLENKQAANDRVAELRSLYGTDALIALAPVAVGPTEAQREADTNVLPTTGYKIVVYPQVDNSVADDISKQTLTMVSTILAAMIGFYFASRSDAAAADPANVVRTNALKDLRELMDATKPEDAVLKAKEKIDAYEKHAREIFKNDEAKLSGALKDVEKLRAELSRLDGKLKAAKTVRENDKSSYIDVMTSRMNIDAVNDAFPLLQKDIEGKQQALPA